MLDLSNNYFKVARSKLVNPGLASSSSFLLIFIIKRISCDSIFQFYFTVGQIAKFNSLREYLFMYTVFHS